jgi:hypothetical protein
MTEKIRFEKYTDSTMYTRADGQEAIDAAIEYLDRRDISYFCEKTPGYYESPRNAELIVGWCAARGIPTTFWNLTLAFRDLSKDGQLEQAPPPAEVPVDTSRGVIEQIGDALAEYVPGAKEAAALAKLRDDSSLSDRARKNRDEKLRLLAGKQRRELASKNLYR